MALIKDLDGALTQIANANHVFPNCYCRVLNPVNMNKDHCGIQVEWWISQEVADEGGKFPLLVSNHRAPGVLDPEFQEYVLLGEGNIITAMYLWLKDQPEFTGAIDA